MLGMLYLNYDNKMINIPLACLNNHHECNFRLSERYEKLFISLVKLRWSFLTVKSNPSTMFLRSRVTEISSCPRCRIVVKASRRI